MVVYSDREIIDGFRQHSPDVIRYIYNACYSSVSNYVIKNHGESKDVEDIFQEGLIQMYKKIENNQIDIKKNFFSYFYGVCKHLWLTELRKRKIKKIPISDCEICSEEENIIEENSTHDEKQILFKYYFKKLTTKCQSILKLFVSGLSIAEITKSLGYSSEEYTRSRKYACKKTLIEKITKNPMFNDINTF